MPDIFIGILTRNRLPLVIQLIEDIYELTESPFDLVVVVDRDPLTFDTLSMSNVNTVTPIGEGAPAGRNKILAEFLASDADYLFEFEDDLRPIKKGYDLPFIDALDTGPAEILFALGEEHGSFLPSTNPEVGWRLNEQTPLTVMTRHCAETLGGYDEAFGTRYGFEDVEFSYRAQRAGLMGHPDYFACLRDGASLYQKVPNPPSSDKKSQQERDADVVYNHRVLVDALSNPVYCSNPELWRLAEDIVK
jgi:hypothetical protein